MKTLSDILIDAKSVLGNRWKKRDARQVPSVDDISLNGNESAELDAVVLCADMNGSTQMVRGYKNWFSAEMYKLYLHSVSEIVKNNQGTVTAFDGDRVMAVYVGNQKHTDATRTAMQIVFVVNKLNQLISEQYKDVSFRIKHSIGIDSSSLFAIRAGVRGANDIVWVGEAANIAAKLTSVDDPDYQIYITKRVYDAASDVVKFTDGKNMWTGINELIFGRQVLKTNWWWRVS